MSLIASEYLKYKKKEAEKVDGTEKLRRILVCLFVVPFVFWAFDACTSFYAIDVLGVAGEENPLGWPFAVLGALVFYVPALAFNYVLLFKVKDRYSPLVAILITALALFSGVMNLCAGLHNLGLIFDFLYRR